jgi:chromosomal replication initiation ATPase DnaA
MAQKQEVLPMIFEATNSANDDFILSLCNIEAYNSITGKKLWPNNRLLILGEPSSGKSHLAKIWSDRASAISFNGSLECLYQNTSDAIIAENIDMLSNEADLFHLINYCMQEGRALLMTARTLPSFKLRDLTSRLNATQKVLIKAPDDELVMILLRKYFTDNQIYLDNEVFEYIGNRIERSFAAIADLVKSLNTASLKQQRAITIPFVKSIIENNNTTSNPYSSL